MRSWFVGILFVLGIFLYLYKGFSTLENCLLNIAGLSALGVALFPTGWNCGDSCNAIRSMAYSPFCSSFASPQWRFSVLKRLFKEFPLKDAAKTRAFLWWYMGLGVFMLIFPFIAWAVS